MFLLFEHLGQQWLCQCSRHWLGPWAWFCLWQVVIKDQSQRTTQYSCRISFVTSLCGIRSFARSVLSRARNSALGGDGGVCVWRRITPTARLNLKSMFVRFIDTTSKPAASSRNSPLLLELWFKNCKHATRTRKTPEALILESKGSKTDRTHSSNP